MTILIEVRNEYLIAQGCTIEEGKWLGERGWWYYGPRSNGVHARYLSKLGVKPHSRYLPAKNSEIAAAVLDVENVGWTDAARAVCAAAAKNIEASRDAGEEVELKIPAPEGLSYRPYQLAGVQFALNAWKQDRKGVLIGDEMGLGKTMQGIGCMVALDAERVLVLCLSSLTFNWKREIEKWWPGVAVRVAKKQEDLEGARVVVVAYSSLAGSSERAMGLKMALQSTPFDLAVLDEAHVLKNDTTQTSRAVLGRWKRGVLEEAGIIHWPSRVLVMTGTPIQNEVRESLPLIRAVGGIGEKGICERDVQFLYRYCGPEKVVIGRRTVTTFEGATKLDELQSKLRGSGLMIRRLKAQVATELPPKLRSLVFLDPGDSDDPFDVRHRGTVESFDAAHLLAKQVEFVDVAGYLSRIAERKIPLAIDHVKDLLEAGRNVIVFAHHQSMVDALEAAFAKQSIRIDGSTPTQDRLLLVDQFQRDASKRVAVVSIRAGGTGLTLTKADTVVFAETDWNPAQCVQAEDRAHRIGQDAEAVHVQYLVLDGTIDANVVRTMILKLDIADRALDRQAPKGPAPEPPKSAPKAMLRRVEIKAKGERLTYEITDDRLAAIREAFATLSGQCDGAHSRDDVGFNGNDARSEFVQSLCRASLDGSLTDKQAAWALHVLRTYRKTQLAHIADRLFA